MDAIIRNPAEMAAMSCRDITARYVAILAHFDEYAEPGEDDVALGLVGGWDWPTMNAVFPELCIEVRALKVEAKHRAESGAWKD